MTSTTSTPGSAPRPGVRSAVAGDLVAGVGPLLAAAGATWWLLGSPASQVPVALGLYLAMAVLLLVRVPPTLPGPGLGPANRVTLFRATLAAPIVALCLPPRALGDAGSWWVIALGTAVMVLDGLDGRLARRTGTTTRFGARFDMEVDAALILALAVLVWSGGRAGAWCLLIGLMRYGFVVAGWIWPALAGELPESLRRKVVCVVQGVVLLVALGPIVPEPVASAAVAAGLLALAYSFAVDIRWALGRPPPAPGP